MREAALRLSVHCAVAAVGFGDMVPMTFVGRFAVLVMICVGVVLIPVQASQVYSQLQARRVTLGETDCGLSINIILPSTPCVFKLKSPIVIFICAVMSAAWRMPVGGDVLQ